MISLTSFAKLSLPLIAAVAFYCTWILGERNDFIPRLREIEAAKPSMLPGTDVPVKLVYTGFLKGVDHQLAVLAIAFWPLLDGSTPNLSLQAFELTGQFLAFWTVAELEARRVCHRWKIISFGMIWGILMQIFGFTNIWPLYLCLHLFTSPVATRSNGRRKVDRAGSLFIEPIDVVVLPISVLLGFVGPIVLMCLPCPTLVSYETRQMFMSLWQIFPVSVGLIQLALGKALSTTSWFQRSDQSSAERDAVLLRNLRRTYIFALVCASITHVAAWTLSLSAHLFPMIFQPHIASSLHPAHVFLPPPPFNPPKIANLGEGLLDFLLYDGYIGSLATLLWTTVVYHNAGGGWRTRTEPLKLLGIIAGATVVGGPASATVLLLWRRDELVLSGGSKNRRKRTL